VRIACIDKQLHACTCIYFQYCSSLFFVTWWQTMMRPYWPARGTWGEWHSVPNTQEVFTSLMNSGNLITGVNYAVVMQWQQRLVGIVCWYAITYCIIWTSRAMGNNWAWSIYYNTSLENKIQLDFIDLHTCKLDVTSAHELLPKFIGLS